MGWKLLLTSPEGRISRKPFWVGVVALLAFVLSASLLVFLAIETFVGTPSSPSLGIGGILGGVLFYGLAVSLFAKRWHDRGKSGWWTLIALVPVAGAIWILVELGFLRGTVGPNQYGNDPLAG